MRPLASFSTGWWVVVGVIGLITSAFFAVGSKKIDKALGVRQETEVPSNSVVKPDLLEEMDPEQIELAEKIYAAIQSRDSETATELQQKYIDQFGGDSSLDDFTRWSKLQIGLSSDEVDVEAIAGFVATTADEDADIPFADPTRLNNAAWSVWLEYEKDPDIDPRRIRDALLTAHAALPMARRTRKPAFLLDTIAHLEFASGNLSAAWKIQNEAIRLSSPQESKEMLAFLKQLEEARANEGASEGASESNDDSETPN